MNYRLIALAAAALVTACANQPEDGAAHVALGPGYATEPAPPAPLKADQIRQYADQNNDGKVTRDEARVDPALAKSFDRYDLDHNDVLDRGEFARLEDSGRMPRPAGLQPGWMLEAPGVMPYDEAAGAEPAQGSSLNRTGVDRPTHE